MIADASRRWRVTPPPRDARCALSLRKKERRKRSRAPCQSAALAAEGDVCVRQNIQTYIFVVYRRALGADALSPAYELNSRNRRPTSIRYLSSHGLTLIIPFAIVARDATPFAAEHSFSFTTRLLFVSYRDEPPRTPTPSTSVRRLTERLSTRHVPITKQFLHVKGIIFRRVAKRV